MTWSSRGSSEKWGILFAHSTKANSCLSAVWQMLETASWGCKTYNNYFLVTCKTNKADFVLFFRKIREKKKTKITKMDWLLFQQLTEFPADPLSEWRSTRISTAISASKIFSTGISSFTPELNSSSPSRSLFLWRSSWTAAADKHKETLPECTQGDLMDVWIHWLLIHHESSYLHSALTEWFYNFRSYFF